MKNKKLYYKKINKATLLLLMLLLIILGTSFALWQSTVGQTNQNSLVIGCINIEIVDETAAINLPDATPISDEEGKKLVPYTFKVKNNCSNNMEYVINLETISEGEKILSNEYIKASLVKADTEVFLGKLTIENENLEKAIETSTSAYKLYKDKIESKESISYSLRLWIDSETSNLEDIMGAVFASKITITANYIPKRDTNEKILYNIIEKQASLDNTKSEFVRSSSGIDFGLAPSDINGKGVYTIASTKDYYYPVHYFRGEVTNNNVKFANFCWKIVRTTETGGVKLIYNGEPDESGGCTNTTGEITQIGKSSFNKNYDLADYVGYMYPETNENNSTIKTIIDTWYQSNMADYTRYLEDTVWCNDRSIYKTEDANIYYGAVGRNADSNKPSIVCPNDNDKFTVSSDKGNGKLTYPVALLTTDEIVFAGIGLRYYSEISYLYTNQVWWSLSPNHIRSNGAAYAFIILLSGYQNLASVAVTAGVRPSISLASGTMISSGTGTANFPFEIL